MGDGPVASDLVIKDAAALLAIDDFAPRFDSERGLGSEFHVASHADFVLERHHGAIAFASEESVVGIQ